MDGLLLDSLVQIIIIIIILNNGIRVLFVFLFSNMVFASLVHYGYIFKVYCYFLQLD